MKFYLKHFKDLSNFEVAEIFRLRATVFVVEQNCAYVDPDSKDEDAYHLMLRDDKELIGYSRLLKPGVSYSEPSIGRVVVATTHRKQGAGRKLMQESIRYCRELFRTAEIVISAQTYLTGFYSSLGFRAEGTQYDEDGIPHVKMRLQSQALI